MPSLSEMFTKSALDMNEQRDPNPGSGFQVGAQIAMHAQDIQVQQKQLQQKQQELQQAKFAKFADAVEKGQQYTGKAQSNYYNKFLPQYRDALGLKGAISDDAMQFNGTSPEMIQALGALISKVRQGTLTQEQALDIYHDPQKMADMYGITQTALNSSPLDQKLLEELGKSETTQVNNNAIMQKQKNEQAQAGNVELAKETAKSYNAYATGGGKSGMQGALARLGDAATALETGNVKTGGLTTKIPGFKSDNVQSMVNPDMVNMKVQAQSAMNTVLRATLGSAFTEQEGERVLAQVWDDRQPPSVNAAKLRNKISELQQNVGNAETEFKKQGFLKGGSATTPAPGAKPLPQVNGGGPAPKPAADGSTPISLNLHQLDDPKVAKALQQKIQSNVANATAIAAKYGITVGQLYKLLGMQAPGGQ